MPVIGMGLLRFFFSFILAYAPQGAWRWGFKYICYKGNAIVVSFVSSCGSFARLSGQTPSRPLGSAEVDGVCFSGVDGWGCNEYWTAINGLSQQSWIDPRRARRAKKTVGGVPIVTSEWF